MARVMIVDDSPTDKVFVRQILERAGHEVLEANNGKEGIEQVRLHRPDCVVMDVVMPGVNGFQATRTLSRDPATMTIPIVVLSSKSQETDRVWALRQGAKEYLVKPVNGAELVEKIQDVMRRS